MLPPLQLSSRVCGTMSMMFIIEVIQTCVSKRSLLRLKDVASEEQHSKSLRKL